VGLLYVGIIIYFIFIITVIYMGFVVNLCLIIAVAAVALEVFL